MISLDDPLRASIEKHLRSLVTPREDWQHAHISDLYGCTYETWARRSSDEAPVEDRDYQGALRMAIGNDYEDKIAAGIIAAFPPNCAWRNERIAWNPYTMQTRRMLPDAGHVVGEPQTLGNGSVEAWVCKGCEHCLPAPGELIGHGDVFVQVNGESTVFEIKSTSHFAFKKAIAAVIDSEHHYVEQTAGYAIAIDAKAGVFIADRDNCEVEGPLWLDLDALREVTIRRAKEVLERTNPEAFPPEPEPRYSWQPKYCSLGDACACKE